MPDSTEAQILSAVCVAGRNGWDGVCGCDPCEKLGPIVERRAAGFIESLNAMGYEIVAKREGE